MAYQQVVVTRFGGPEVLCLEELPQLPEPGMGEVRVRVLAAGTGFTDTIIRQGQYPGVRVKPPFVPGYDWFGRVDKLGPGVTALRVGQLVADMPVIGGYTQYLCAKAKDLVPAPDGLEPARAVAMILSYTTAYQLLTRIRTLPRGATCLVHAAGGAVGTAVLDLARNMDIRVFGTCSKPKHEVVKRLGGIPIDYRSEDFVQRVLEYTGGSGVDLVLDTIGGRNWARSYRCVRRGGMLVAFGALQYTTGREKLPSLLLGFMKLMVGWKLVPDGRATTFYNIQSRREKYPTEFREDLARLFHLLAAGDIDPVIEAIEPLANVVEVHRKIDRAGITGKVVLNCE